MATFAPSACAARAIAAPSRLAAPVSRIDLPESELMAHRVAKGAQRRKRSQIISRNRISRRGAEAQRSEVSIFESLEPKTNCLKCLSFPRRRESIIVSMDTRLRGYDDFRFRFPNRFIQISAP